MIILTLLGYIFLFFLALLLLVLVVPVDYDLIASKYENIKFKGSIRWFWSLKKMDFFVVSTDPKVVSIRLLGFPISIDLSEEEKKKTSKKQKEKKVKSKDKFSLSKEHFTSELLDVVLSTIKDILHRMKPNRFTLKGTYGFDDPYYTGIMLAIVSSLSSLFNDYPIDLAPSFGEAKLEGEGEIQGRVIVILFLTIMLKLILSKPIRKIIKTLFNKKKEEKKHVN
ncbi:MAG: DUF2953 domain-containing protein [Clostridiaceae bacterium]|nr:DUF2953 domain-containing protein [Clostridiaceae bacterium]